MKGLKLYFNNSLAEFNLKTLDFQGFFKLSKCNGKMKAGICCYERSFFTLFL